MVHIVHINGSFPPNFLRSIFFSLVFIMFVGSVSSQFHSLTLTFATALVQTLFTTRVCHATSFRRK